MGERVREMLALAVAGAAGILVEGLITLENVRVLRYSPAAGGEERR